MKQKQNEKKKIIMKPQILKQRLLEDLKEYIQYTPDMETDLLCLMEQYLKANYENRPELLEQIKLCMNGEEYRNPFLAYSNYDESHINEFEKILAKLEQTLYMCSGKQAEQKAVLIDTVEKINHLNNQCRGQLMDYWRDEILTEYLIKFSEENDFYKTERILRDLKNW